MLLSLKDAGRALLYHTGLWPLWHRLRNRRHLTVFMFHRVLPAGSVALARSEREYALSVPGFERCLDFIGRHYGVVSLEQLQTPERLPPCPALITFDDGWQDTLLHAAPALQARGMPGLVFAVPQAMADPRARWWADALVEALGSDASRASMQQVLGIDADDVHACHAAMAAVPEDQRWQLGVLDATAPGGNRQMLTEAQLTGLAAAGLALGAHGLSHCPLTHTDQADLELSRSAEWLSHHTTGPRAMAFPHGAWTPALAARAHHLGFAWVFNSVTTLVKVPANPAGWPVALGRIHVPENAWTCDAGGMSFPKLASFFFFRGLAR